MGVWQGKELPPSSYRSRLALCFQSYATSVRPHWLWAALPPYLSCHLPVSAHQSLSVFSTRQQRFINVPGFFLCVSAASDVHQLQLVKKHSLVLCNLLCSLLHSKTPASSSSPFIIIITPSLCSRRTLSICTLTPAFPHSLFTSSFTSALPSLPHSASVCWAERGPALLLYNVIYISWR